MKKRKVKTMTADKALPDNTKHGNRRPPIIFVNPRRKPLAEVMGEDIPQGLSAEDVATDYPQRPWK
jgi:hypothetical protein